MKIAIFGATGRTGVLVVDEALAADHEVVAFTRSPEKLSRWNANVTIVEGDLTDAEAIERAIAGTQAIISVMGPSNNRDKMAISSGMEKITASMKKQGVRRLIMTAGAGIPDPDDRPNLMSKFMGTMVRTLSRNVYEDMLRSAEIVRSSELDWTIVRVPVLADGPKKGNVTVAWVGRGMGRSISRADLAEFIVSQLQDDTYIHMAPAVSS